MISATPDFGRALWTSWSGCGAWASGSTRRQDAAYGTLLREPRRTLHARIAETLDGQFPEIAESQPELLARHYTEACLIEKAARRWGAAGQRSLARSALVEAAEQVTRALAQIDALPNRAP